MFQGPDIDTESWEKRCKAKPGKDGESHFWRFSASSTGPKGMYTVETDGLYKDALKRVMPRFRKHYGKKLEGVSIKLT